MRTIDGYICIASFPTQDDFSIRELFGPGTPSSGLPYNNFRTNGLTPYPTHADALKGMDLLRGRSSVSAVDLACIKLQIAESEEEHKRTFAEAENLVVLGYNNDTNAWHLRGKSIDEYRTDVRAVPGAPVTYTDFLLIESLESAEYIAYEVSRQMRLKDICLARMWLDIISEKSTR